MRLIPVLAAASLSIGLAGCDLPFISKPDLMPEAIAIGSGCAQGSKPLEICYDEHRDMPRAGILQGWKEMQTYLAENKLTPANTPAIPVPSATVTPTPPTPETKPVEPEAPDATSEASDRS